MNVFSGLLKFIDRFKTSPDFFMKIEHFELMHLGEKKVRFFGKQKNYQVYRRKISFVREKNKKNETSENKKPAGNSFGLFQFGVIYLR